MDGWHFRRASSVRIHGVLHHCFFSRQYGNRLRQTIDFTQWSWIIVQRQVDYSDEFAGKLERLTADPVQFSRRKTLRRITISFANAYDCLRAGLKRLRGF